MAGRSLSVIFQVYRFSVLNELALIINDPDDQGARRTSTDFFAICQLVLRCAFSGGPGNSHSERKAHQSYCKTVAARTRVKVGRQLRIKVHVFDLD